MFGYVLPRRDKLSQQELLRYRGAYCGLCSSLKKHYGFRARFLVNYDITFLYFLLSQERATLCRCSCPVRPFCKKDCMPDDEILSYGADISVLLSYWKLYDALQDGRGGKRLSARLALWLYKKPYRKAAKRQPEANAVFEQQLEKLRRLEQQHCASLDRAADAFAGLLRVCVCGNPSEDRKRLLQQLLYHVGRYLYLVDALEDLPKDLKADSYNPLRYRYELRDGQLSKEDREQLIDTIEASISMAASALELLLPGPNEEILKNIIYYGLPAVLKSVNEGNFRKRRSKE